MQTHWYCRTTVYLVPTTLTVVQYKSLVGGYGRWAFCLVVKEGNETINYILQVISPSGPFEYEERVNVDPTSSARYIRSVPVIDNISGQITIAHVKELISKQEIKDAVQWSCQDWILEALETLNLEEEIDNYTYAQIKEQLEMDYMHF
jgi:hypothetical protein